MNLINYAQGASSNILSFILASQMVFTYMQLVLEGLEVISVEYRIKWACE